MIPCSDSLATWVLMQAGCYLSAGFVPEGLGQAEPGHHAYRLPGPTGWLVTAHQTHVDDWKIAVR